MSPLIVWDAVLRRVALFQVLIDRKGCFAVKKWKGSGERMVEMWCWDTASTHNKRGWGWGRDLMIVGWLGLYGDGFTHPHHWLPSPSPHLLLPPNLSITRSFATFIHHPWCSSLLCRTSLNITCCSKPTLYLIIFSSLSPMYRVARDHLLPVPLSPSSLTHPWYFHCSLSPTPPFTSQNPISVILFSVSHLKSPLSLSPFTLSEFFSLVDYKVTPLVLVP